MNHKILSDGNFFPDGLIKFFSFDWISQGNNEKFSIKIETAQGELPSRDVEIIVSNVLEFKFAHHRTKLNYQILSNGIHICQIDGVWCMEFGTFADPPTSIAEVMESDFYIIGKEIELIDNG